ncbi:MAG TPA: hypothetical protein VFK80_06200 [Limnochordia bacterium]|nr:hypothetical protein [Limnochordia bacterium]
MSFWKALFGKTDLPKSDLDRVFALVTAQTTLEVNLGWTPAGRAGICVKPQDSGDFAASEREMVELLRFAAQESRSEVQVQTDEYNYRWFLFSDPDLDDLVNLIHMAGQTLSEHGYGPQMLSAAFRFKRTRDGDRPGFLIYNYKRANFYPFVALNEADKKRDNAEELHASGQLSTEMPIERDQSRWFALWGSPV